MESCCRLDALLQAFSPSRTPHEQCVAHAWDVLYAFESVLTNTRSHRAPLLYRGRRAQLVVDVLQWLLDFGLPLGDHQRRMLVKGLTRLAIRAEVLPSCMHINQPVEGLQVIGGSSAVDILKGSVRGRVVCLKKPRIVSGEYEATREKVVKWFMREAITWRNYHYSSVLPFERVMKLDGGPFDLGLYLISPFLGYGTIVQYLQKYPRSNRCLLLKDILQGAHDLHHSEIIHGDLKGANILVNSEGRAVLADLGISRLSTADLANWTSCQTTNRLGTLKWQSPEHLRAMYYEDCAIEPTEAGDIYALGCVAYEIFVGRTPFYEISGWGTFMRQVLEEGRSPKKPKKTEEAYSKFGLTEDIWRTMEECWAIRPKDRPSALDLGRKSFLRQIADTRPPYKH